jgi:hypothetical protein
MQQPSKRSALKSSAERWRAVESSDHYLLTACCLPLLPLLSQEEWPEDEAAKQQIRADFSSNSSIGDRRQELVFIGQVGHLLLLLLLLLPNLLWACLV